MELFEFTKALTNLCDFYERKEPRQASIDLWFKLVQRMPSEPVPWIVKKIQDTYETFPKNMTAAFWGSFTEWKQAHPEKTALKSYFNCPDCQEGLIFAKHKENKNKFVFRCSRCRQDNTPAYPLSSRLELLQDYEVRA